MAGSIMAGQTTNYLFDYPTSTDYVKDGATAIQELADDVDATLFTALGGDYPGLRLIKSQAIGTAVSQIDITDVFSATYDNYFITVNNCVPSVANAFQIRIGNATTAYFGAVSIVFFAAGTQTLLTDNNSATFNQAFSAQGTPDIQGSFNLISPFLNRTTIIQSHRISGTASGHYGGILNNTNSSTGFTFFTSSGTVTGGTIRVYGYGAS
jgi:hypothetical protein